MKNIGLIIILVILSSTIIGGLFIPSSYAQSNQQHENENTLTEDPSDNNSTQTTPEIKIIVYQDNWFDFVNEYFEKYTTAQVIDVDTLITYTVKRVGGYNHADVEPISVEDTAKMYSIYDNEWSWVRRAVWVKYGDRYIAASINGYPHSYDLVEDNDMTGHTCIHFLMSRTHGTNRVDEAHQAAVEKAYNNQQRLNDFLNNKL